MKYFIKIINTNNLIDKTSLNEIILLGYNNIQTVSKAKIYSITGKLGLKEIKFICENLLVDPIVEQYQINKKEIIENIIRVNIWYKPLVLDIVAENVKKGIKYLGIDKELEIHSGTQVTLYPKVNKKIVEQIIEKIYINKLIQEFEIL